MFRSPKHHSVWATACIKDEPPVRPAAIPPTDYDDIPHSYWGNHKSWKTSSKARKAWGKHLK